ncbi:MAG TPA: Wzz/FepE/Etk N-terminal domain-containing protein, partial [Terriglobales bacterium]|nr:Wzz/FepE/Etk N-terminal domain-containing protein [Terriglobales bacterium]
MKESKSSTAIKLTTRDVMLDPSESDSSESLLLEPIESTPSLLPHLRLFWENRRLLWRAAIVGLLASVIAAFVIPVRYQSVTRLMPPDDQSSSGLGMLAAMASGSGASGLAGMAGDLLGIKSSGDLFIGVLGSDTIQDDL